MNQVILQDDETCQPQSCRTTLGSLHVPQRLALIRCRPQYEVRFDLPHLNELQEGKRSTKQTVAFLHLSSSLVDDSSEFISSPASAMKRHLKLALSVATKRKR